MPRMRCPQAGPACLVVPLRVRGAGGERGRRGAARLLIGSARAVRPAAPPGSPPGRLPGRAAPGAAAAQARRLCRRSSEVAGEQLVDGRARHREQLRLHRPVNRLVSPRRLRAPPCTTRRIPPRPAPSAAGATRSASRSRGRPAPTASSRRSGSCQQTSGFSSSGAIAALEGRPCAGRTRGRPRAPAG